MAYRQPVIAAVMRTQRPDFVIGEYSGGDDPARSDEGDAGCTGARSYGNNGWYERDRELNASTKPARLKSVP